MAFTRLGYSMITRYEMGLIPALPFKMHLALDAVAGTLLAASPVLFADEDSGTVKMLAALGAYELAVTMLSRTRTHRKK